jgi:acetyltransferase-like isoleucine patch superfamily enzyme
MLARVGGPAEGHRMEMHTSAATTWEYVSPHARVPHRRLTWRHVSAFARWARLKARHRNLRGAVFFLDKGAFIEIGKDCDIEMAPGVRIMRDFTGFFHEGRIRIGRDTLISRGVYLSSVRGVSVGDHCLIGERVSIHDMDHDFGAHVSDVPLVQRPLRAAPIVIGNNVWVGAKATITSGVHIGDDVVIAANAVVTSDIPSHCVAGGIPARVLKSWNPEPSLRLSSEGGVSFGAAHGRSAERSGKGNPC